MQIKGLNDTTQKSTAEQAAQATQPELEAQRAAQQNVERYLADQLRGELTPTDKLVANTHNLNFSAVIQCAQAGGDVNVTFDTANAKNVTPLHYLTQNVFLVWAKANKASHMPAKYAQDLINYGAKVDATLADKFTTPLLVVAQKYQADMAKTTATEPNLAKRKETLNNLLTLFVSAGADVNVKDNGYFKDGVYQTALNLFKEDKESNFFRSLEMGVEDRFIKREQQMTAALKAQKPQEAATITTSLASDMELLSYDAKIQAAFASRLDAPLLLAAQQYPVTPITLQDPNNLEKMQKKSALNTLIRLLTSAGANVHVTGDNFELGVYNKAMILSNNGRPTLLDKLNEGLKQKAEGKKTMITTTTTSSQAPKAMKQ